MKSKQLMKAIGGIEDKYIEAADPSHGMAYSTISAKKPLKIWRFAPIAASLVLIVALAAVFGNNPSWFNHADNNSGVIISDDSDNISPIASDNTQTNLNGTEKTIPSVQTALVINSLTGAPGATSDIGLLWDDAVSKTPGQLQEYYGTNIYPKVLPAGFRKDMIVDDSSYGNFWIFQTANRGIYYDQNTILYESEAAVAVHEQQGYRDYSLPSITVTVSKEYAIHWDFLLEGLSEAPLKASSINGHNLTVCKFVDGYGEHYVAYFAKNGVNFEIVGNLISQDEFTKTVTGYFAD